MEHNMNKMEHNMNIPLDTLMIFGSDPREGIKLAVIEKYQKGDPTRKGSLEGIPCHGEVILREVNASGKRLKSIVRYFNQKNWWKTLADQVEFQRELMKKGRISNSKIAQLDPKTLKSKSFREQLDIYNAAMGAN